MTVGMPSNLKKRGHVYASPFQWRSQNAEKATHIKGELLDQAVVFFNCIPFQNGNFLPLRVVPYGIQITFITLSDFPCMLLF